MRRASWLSLVLCLAVPSSALAQAAADVPSQTSPTDAPPATAPAVAVPPSASTEGSPGPGEPLQAPAPQAQPAPVSTQPEPLRAPQGYAVEPLSPPAARPLATSRSVLLPPPRVRAVEPRPSRHGDAGAPYAVAIGGALLWRSDAGYEILHDERKSGVFELSASYDVFQLSRVVVSAGASYQRYVADGDAALELRQHALQAELMARHTLMSWLWPHVRAGVGFVTTRVSITDPVSNTEFGTRDTGVMGSVGGGLTLRTPTRLFETYEGRLASLSLGLLVEGGYHFAPAAELLARPDDDSNGIARRSASLGSLERKAPYARMAAVARF